MVGAAGVRTEAAIKEEPMCDRLGTLEFLLAS
jgi:hypothetical protein